MEKETGNNEFEVKPVEQIRRELDAAKANISQEEIALIRGGLTKAEAVGTLKRIRATNNVLKSADGHIALLSRNSEDKLICNDACDKSIKNGFARKQHYAAAADIDRLFANARKVATHPDQNNDPNIKAMHRFAAPLYDGNVAYITVKESAERGKRMYSVELTEIRKLGATMGEVARSITKPGSPSFLNTNNITLSGKKVNSKHKK